MKKQCSFFLKRYATQFWREFQDESGSNIILGLAFVFMLLAVIPTIFAFSVMYLSLNVARTGADAAVLGAGYAVADYLSTEEWWGECGMSEYDTWVAYDDTLAAADSKSIAEIAANASATDNGTLSTNFVYTAPGKDTERHVKFTDHETNQAWDFWTINIGYVASRDVPDVAGGVFGLVNHSATGTIYLADYKRFDKPCECSDEDIDEGGDCAEQHEDAVEDAEDFSADEGAGVTGEDACDEATAAAEDAGDPDADACAVESIRYGITLKWKYRILE